jgi:hypothetical protein
MGLDWIDDILQKAEGLPLLGGIAHDLRYAYEIWRVDPPDPKPVQTQHDTLDSLHNRAATLRTSFNESLYTLQSNWTGNGASYYFGPQPTHFQIEHDLEPPTTGAGYLLWNRLDQITSTLEYNRAAHQQAFTTLTQIVELHGELQSEVYEAAGLLVADAATTAIPGLEELDALDVPITIERVDKAVETAQEVEKVAEAVKTVEEVAKDVSTGLQLINIVRAFGALVGIALLTFLLSSDSPAIPKNGPQPPVALSQEQQDMLQRLARDYPDLPPDVLEALVTSGLSEDEIRALLERFGVDAIIGLVRRWGAEIATILKDLYLVRNVPGMERLVNDLITGAQNTALGSLYQLFWVVDHLNQVARVEDTDTNGNKAADVILTDGSILDTKTLDWSRYNKFTLGRQIAEMEAQIRRDQGLYPGEHITYVFDSQYGDVPDAVKEALKELDVTVKTWP